MMRRDVTTHQSCGHLRRLSADAVVDASPTCHQPRRHTRPTFRYRLPQTPGRERRHGSGTRHETGHATGHAIGRESGQTASPRSSWRRQTSSRPHAPRCLASAHRSGCFSTPRISGTPRPSRARTLQHRCLRARPPRLGRRRGPQQRTAGRRAARAGSEATRLVGRRAARLVEGSQRSSRAGRRRGGAACRCGDVSCWRPSGPRALVGTARGGWAADNDEDARES